MYQIIDGKKVSQKVKDELKIKVEKLKESGIFPGLAVIIVGNDSASRVYVNNKKKACEYIGIRSEEYALPEETTVPFAETAPERTKHSSPDPSDISFKFFKK